MRYLAKEVIRTAGENTAGGEVEVSGWVHRIRELGGVSFVVLRDRSGVLQIVLSEDLAAAGKLTPESVIRVRGVPALNEKAPGGAELRAVSLEVISRAAPDLPYQVNGDISRTGLETILDNRILSLRNPKIRAIFTVQASIIEAFSAYLRGRDFTEIKTSKIVGSGTEGGTELFEVDYFDRKVYLAQSPQFYKEVMVASGLERVFEAAPAYRAEKHDTPRHLNEYVSLDVEMGFIESEKDLIELEKGLLAHIFDHVGRKNAEELALWNAAVPDPASLAGAPTVPYEEALKIANDEAAAAKKGGSPSAGRIFDINPEAERLICAWAGREHGIELVFVNEFPRRYRPFYTYPLNSGEGGASSLTMSFDALFRGLEITTGGRRQHDYNAFLETLPKFGLKPGDFTGYLSLLKYGCPPHGGFAVGCERLTQKILGLSNVKEASLFPRDRKRVEP
ncbi:MAG: aspartate--tRNA(Asn) ligase [Treponema sp.]|jgi:nondiscriminating aspartyl-tRNA synthetase|nr:aspartate--tRNA(Asn) ligase [Treponema sp.]